MARSLANMDETFRVVVTGTRTYTRYFEYDRVTGASIRLDSPKVTTVEVREVFGPYGAKGVARAQGGRVANRLDPGATVTVERATTTWEAVP